MNQEDATKSEPRATESARSRSVPVWRDPLWVGAFATVALVLATLVLIGITAWYAALTRQMMMAAVDPILEVAVIPDGKELAIGNLGAFPIIDVSVKVDTVVLRRDARSIVPAGGIWSGRDVPGRPRHEWWAIKRLEPGESRSQGMDELVRNATELWKMNEGARARGELRGIKPTDAMQFFPVLIFRVAYRREVDRKTYTKEERALVLASAKGGSTVWGSDVPLEYFREILRSPR